MYVSRIADLSAEDLYGSDYLDELDYVPTDGGLDELDELRQAIAFLEVEEIDNAQ